MTQDFFTETLHHARGMEPHEKEYTILAMIAAQLDDTNSELRRINRTNEEKLDKIRSRLDGIYIQIIFVTMATCAIGIVLILCGVFEK